MEEPPIPVIHREILNLIFACFFLEMALMSVVTTVFPNYFDTVSESLVVLLMGVDPIFQVLFSVYGANLLRTNFAQKKLTLLGWALAGLFITTCVYMFAIGMNFTVWTVYGLILVARSLSGVLSNIINTTGFTLCFDYHEPDAHAEASGFLLSGNFLGFTGGSVIGGVLGSYKEWLPFALLAGVNAILSALLLNFTSKEWRVKNSRTTDDDDDVDDDGRGGTGTTGIETTTYASLRGEEEEEEEKKKEDLTDNDGKETSPVTGVGVYKSMHLRAIVFNQLTTVIGISVLELLTVYHLKKDLGVNQLLQACALISLQFAIFLGCSVTPRLRRRIDPDKEHIWLPVFMSGGCAIAGTLSTVAVSCNVLWLYCVMVGLAGLSWTFSLSFSLTMVERTAVVYGLDMPSSVAAMENGISLGALLGIIITAVLLLWCSYLEVAMVTTLFMYAGSCNLFLSFLCKPLTDVIQKDTLLEDAS